MSVKVTVNNGDLRLKVSVKQMKTDKDLMIARINREIKR